MVSYFLLSSGFILRMVLFFYFVDFGIKVSTMGVPFIIYEGINYLCGVIYS